MNNLKYSNTSFIRKNSRFCRFFQNNLKNKSINNSKQLYRFPCHHFFFFNFFSRKLLNQSTNDLSHPQRNVGSVQKKVPFQSRIFGFVHIKDNTYSQKSNVHSLKSLIKYNTTVKIYNMYLNTTQTFQQKLIFTQNTRAQTYVINIYASLVPYACILNQKFLATLGVQSFFPQGKWQLVLKDVVWLRFSQVPLYQQYSNI
eukprot:TRINITY_DN8716_c0_g1_i2.p1 TRINITY_DN8716_c0_g1~~TRINITY_DN8716_c0_g1_i2.p1  ORF type:complete len:200 (+),score=-10.95 TRINITY_DN8716_c0_g1_i2:891-1490(+)